jgi:hypothetical protein
MNDTKAKAGSARPDPMASDRLANITAAVSEEHGIDPAAVPVAEGEGVGAPPGADVRPALLDPALCRKIAAKTLGLVERAASRDLFSTALRATGDRGFADEVARSWAWTDQEREEVADLVYETAKLYSADRFFRPDVALLIAAGTHAAGFLIVKRSIMERVKETKELEKAAAAVPAGDQVK